MAGIRKMTVGDIDEVYRIETENFSDAWGKDSFTDLLLREPTHAFVLIKDRLIIGYIILQIVFDECEIHNISIKKELQQQGWGTKIMDFAFRYCKELGVRKIFLEVREFNLKAINFYESFGFRKVRIIEAYYKQPTENGILMMCDLEYDDEKD